MARRGTWHDVPCHATPRFRENVARRGTWRATRGAEIFTRATPCPVLVLTWRALCPGETWRGVACHARSGTRKTGRAITGRRFLNPLIFQHFNSWKISTFRTLQSTHSISTRDKEKIASKIAPYSKGCFFLAEKTNAFYSICEINRTFLINLIHVL